MILLRLIKIILGALTSAALAVEQANAEEDATQQIRAGLAVDCTRDLNTPSAQAQPCLKVHGIGLSLMHRSSPSLTARLEINPFRRAVASTRSHPQPRLGSAATRSPSTAAQGSEAIALSDAVGIGVAWTPRPHLSVSLETFAGAAWFEGSSGLPQGSQFMDSGWDQLALVLRYQLQIGSGVEVLFAGGNGEGERLANLDPQQYFGFGARIQTVTGLWIHGGFSVDGNNGGSAEHSSTYPGSETTQGFAVRRFSVALLADGRIETARGLKVSLGLQDVLGTDISPDTRGFADQGSSDVWPIDPLELWIESNDPSEANRISRRTWSASASYRILDTLFFGGGIELFSWTSSAASLQGPCRNSTDPCDDREELKEIRASHSSVGLGIDLDQGFVATLDYGRTAYDEPYESAYFVGSTGSRTQVGDSVSLRLAYNWP